MLRVDFQEMVEHNQEHGGAAEEDGEGVKLGVGDHFCGGGIYLKEGEGMLRGGGVQEDGGWVGGV